FDLRTHACRAVEDALDEGALGPGAHVFFGKAGLQRRDLSHRADLAPGLGRTAVDDARLVEMDVRLDQPAADEAPTRVVDLAHPCDPALDRDDLPAGTANTQRFSPPPIGEAGAPDDQIHP